MRVPLSGRKGGVVVRPQECSPIETRLVAKGEKGWERDGLGIWGWYTTAFRVDKQGPPV